MRIIAILAVGAVLAAVLSCGEPFERGLKQVDYVPPPADDDDDTANDDDDDDDTVVDDDDDLADDDDDTAVEPPSFADEVHPILAARCQPCHQDGGSAGSSALVMTGDPGTDHAAVAALADPDHPEDSPLLAKGSGQASHGGQTVLPVDSEDYRLILDWIVAGALE